MITILLLAACVSTPSTGPEADVLSQRTVCDASASAYDWLIEISASTVFAEGVECDLKQGSRRLGAVYLDAVGDNQWYGEVWEDAVGADCEAGNLTATCEAF